VLDDDHINAEAEIQARRVAQEAAAEAPVPREEMLPPLPNPVQLEDQRLAAAAREVTQAVSVAAAYFEDTLQSAPGLVLAAGSMGADVLSTLLREAGFAEGEMRVREMVEPVMLTGGAVSSRVPIGWMAGVRGALRS
jgi:type IV pilus assembly protein PilM